MSKTVIKVEELSKAYQIGQIGTGTISRDIERWVRMNVLRQDDPFLKIGETNDRSKRGSSDIVWSLKDINFEIKEGDAVGIIGRNGAGKSTLLKLLSRVTAPTSGRIKIKGRVASLLEVGTGFHPELSGRENIYLNGAILGMRKKEIDRKLDEIIDFSGVERYIDTPVKRYSSGMYVRLAFAVAAHLESEILIVDEVLAVGDAEFQKKCLGKMGEVSKGEGRTVLFVSHNMAAIQELCINSLLLNFGTIDCFDYTPRTLLKYNQLKSNLINSPKDLNNFLEILDTNVEIENFVNSSVNIIAKAIIKSPILIQNCYLNFIVENEDNDFIIHHRCDINENKLYIIEPGISEIIIKMKNVPIKSGSYMYWFRVYSKSNINDVLVDSEKQFFEVKGDSFGGIIQVTAKWQVLKK